MSDFKNPLELYVAEKLKEIDPNARPTPGSGCGNSLGDVENKFFFVECKIKHVRENIIMDYKKDYAKLAHSLPINTKKEMFVVIENKFGEKFVCIDTEAFFRIVYKAYENEDI